MKKSKTRLGTGPLSVVCLPALFVHGTRGHTRQGAADLRGEPLSPPSFGDTFRRVSWLGRLFFSLSQGGLMNNLNDVVIWGLLPFLVVQAGALLGGLLADAFGLNIAVLAIAVLTGLSETVVMPLLQESRCRWLPAEQVVN